MSVQRVSVICPNPNATNSRPKIITKNVAVGSTFKPEYRSVIQSRPVVQRKPENIERLRVPFGSRFVTKVVVKKEQIRHGSLYENNVNRNCHIISTVGVKKRITFNEISPTALNELIRKNNNDLINNDSLGPRRRKIKSKL